MTFSTLPEMCQFDDRTNNDQLIVYLLKYTSVGSDILAILKGRHFINMKQLNTSMFFLHFSTYLIYSSCHFLTTVQYHVCFLFVLCYFLETQTFHSNYTTMPRNKTRRISVDKSQNTSYRFSFLKTATNYVHHLFVYQH